MDIVSQTIALPYVAREIPKAGNREIVGKNPMALTEFEGAIYETFCRNTFDPILLFRGEGLRMHPGNGLEDACCYPRNGKWKHESLAFRSGKRRTTPHYRTDVKNSY